MNSERDNSPGSSSSSSAFHTRAGSKEVSENPQSILLIELINQLGLFLKHTRHAKGARATAVMFDQIIQRLQTISKMPGHEGGIILRRVAQAAPPTSRAPDYHVLSGSIAFRGAEVFECFQRGHHGTKSLATLLCQAFRSFAEQGIAAIFIQFPGDVAEHIDQLRLALNIVARYRHAIENNASITFRYFGRVMNIPLIHDHQGNPDPNLTLVAGLNGLTAANMRELMKQVEAFALLAGRSTAASAPSSSYNQIFGVRSLRSQLIRPLVEVNNLPWMVVDG